MTDTTPEADGRPTVAVFRPNDERMQEAVSLLDELGADALPDPMLAVEPTGELPREDGEYTILTSKTGADIVEGTGWRPGGTLCAIGEPTADALTAAGYEVDVVPGEFTSAGMVARLEEEVGGARVEVARSDHGSDVLLDGLEAAGAYVHETILYRLVRPGGAGISTERAAESTLDGVLFTSSLTVEHFLDAARERDVEDEVRDGLDDCVVGVIGEPTRNTAQACGIDVDVVPGQAEFDALARAVLEQLSAREQRNE